MDFYETDHFECECQDLSHTVRFYRLDWEEDGTAVEIGFETFLNHYLPWYKRLYAAIRYVFGYQPRFSHYDSWMLKDKDRERLVTMLTK